LKPGAIVTDVGSVKASVIKELESLVAGAGAHFVGSHPMAGAGKDRCECGAGGFVSERSVRRDADEENESRYAAEG